MSDLRDNRKLYLSVAVVAFLYIAGLIAAPYKRRQVFLVLRTRNININLNFVKIALSSQCHVPSSVVKIPGCCHDDG